MSYKPILFNTPMVQAILDGTEYATSKILSAASELTNVVDWFQAENEALCAELYRVTAERDVEVEDSSLIRKTSYKKSSRKMS